MRSRAPFDNPAKSVEAAAQGITGVALQTRSMDLRRGTRSALAGVALAAALAGQDFVLANLALGASSAAAAPANPSPATPSGRPGEWASDNDYPAQALRDHIEGEVGFVLTVGADGVPTQCEVSGSSGNADLDQTTCTLMMERARFHPATDADGHATNGTFASKVRWQIPSDDRPQVVPPEGSERVEYDVLADGTIAHCHVTFSGELVRLMVRDAGAMRCAHEGPYAPPTDKAGKPLKKHVIRIESIEVRDTP
jgi:protein TonB